MKFTHAGRCNNCKDVPKIVKFSQVQLNASRLCPGKIGGKNDSNFGKYSPYT